MPKEFKWARKGNTWYKVDHNGQVFIEPSKVQEKKEEQFLPPQRKEQTPDKSEPEHESPAPGNPESLRESLTPDRPEPQQESLAPPKSEIVQPARPDMVVEEVEIRCGSEKWNVHCSQLAETSELFVAMLTERARQRGEAVVVIDECSPELLGQLLEYMYTSVAPWMAEAAGDEDDNHELSVTEAGTAAFNGIYSCAGERSGCICYAKDDKTVHFDGSFWRMGVGNSRSSEYWCKEARGDPGARLFPPMLDWTVGLGREPAPKVEHRLKCPVEKALGLARQTLDLGDLSKRYAMPDLCRLSIGEAFRWLMRLRDSVDLGADKVRLLRLYQGIPKDELAEDERIQLKTLFTTLKPEDFLEIALAL